MSIVTGVNTVFRHQERDFHIQAEDLGLDSGAFEVRVYDGGSVLWLKRISYDELKAEALPKVDHHKALRAKMEKTILTVEAAIAKGKIG